MSLKKNKKTILGATTPEEIGRERAFKRGLKNFFPDVSIAFVYSDIKLAGNVSEKIKAEGCFGYNKRESILVDGKPIRIAWLPHVKDMPSSYIDWILGRVVECVDECITTDNISVDCR